MSRKSVTRKSVSRKSVSRKSVSRKSVSRKSVSRKSVSRKSVSRKSVSRKSLSRGSLKKGGSKKSEPVEDTEPWKKDVEELGVCDDIWKCHLSVIQEKDTLESGVVDLAGQRANVGNRWPVRIFSMDYIKDKVLNHCSKSKEDTAYSSLCDAIKEAAGRNFDQEIPVELLAYFIKYEMLEFREIDIEKKAEKEKYEQEITDAHLKLDMVAGRKQRSDRPGTRGSRRKSAKRQSTKRQSTKRQSTKRQSTKRQSTKRQSTKRQSTKRQSTKRQSTKRQSTKRQSTKRQSTKRQSTKRQSTKRQSTKRQSTRRQSKKDRKSVAGGRKSVAGGRKSLAGGRKSLGGGRYGGSAKGKGGSIHPLILAWKKKRQNIKFDTKLNTREMPKKDVPYVEDFPVQGPEAYFVITQLRNPGLPKALREIGLPVDSVIMYGDPRIAREDEKLTPQKIEEYRDLLDELEKDYLFKKSDKRQLFDMLKEKYGEQGKLQKFWKDFMHQALTQENKKLFENTILTKYRPDLKAVPLKAESRQEAMKEIFYEELCMLMYFMGRISELYKRYNASVKLFEVEALRTTAPEELKIYNSMMDTIPNEACDVPILLDTLLQQVCHNTEGDDSLVDIQKYGWAFGSPPVPNQTSTLEDQVYRLEVEYDLLKEKEKKIPKKIGYPRTIINGDVIKWKTLHLGKLGKYIRDRTYIMQKIFVDRAAWSKVEIDRTSNQAHDVHLERFRNALGIRNKYEVADWLITLGQLCAMDLPKLWKNENIVFYQDGPVLTLMKDQDVTSTKTLVGSLKCSLSCCTCIEKLCEKKGHPKIFSELDYLNNIRDMPDFLTYQTIYHLYSDRDVIKKEYNQLLNSVVYQFYNAYSTFNVHCRIETPVNLKNFYQHILKEKKQWCLKELSEVSDEDPPKFFKPRMDLLMAHLDTITNPVDVSEQLSLTFKDFIDPKSMREDEIKKQQEEELKKLKEKEKSKEDVINANKNVDKSQTQTAVPPVADPIAAAISQVLKPVVGYVYGLDENQLAVFHERKKNFILRGGSRLNLKFDESIFGKPHLMLKLQQAGHNLVFHTPLFQNNNHINFTFETENGIMMSFTERIPMVEEDTGPIIKQMQSKTSLLRSSRMSKLSSSKRKTKKMSLTTFSINYRPIEREDPDKAKFSQMEKKRLFQLFEENSKNFKDKIFKKLSIKKSQTYELCDCIMTLLKSRLSHLPRPFSYHKPGCQFRSEKYENKLVNKFVSEPFHDPELSDIRNNEQFFELDLQMSLPTGLHVSVLRQPKIGGIYVKQCYLAERRDLPFHNETHRYVLFNGTVIKFMKSGEIEIYYPWGAIVYIKNVAWTEHEIIEADATTEIILPREIIFPWFLTTTSDGMLVEHMYGSVSSTPPEYMEDLDDLFSNTRSTERSDGTQFLYDEEGTSIVRFPDGTEIRTKCGFKSYEYFVDWSNEELDTWFGDEEEEEEDEELLLASPSEIQAEEAEEEYLKKIVYAKDGFVVVEIWSYSVFHPHFAGVTSGCVEKKIMNLYLPGDTSVHISDRSLYKIFIGKKKDFRFKVGSKQIILDTLKNNRLFQSSVLNYAILRSGENRNTPKTLFSTKTDDFTDLKIDTKGEIYFKFIPPREEFLNLANAKVDKRQFLIKSDNSGMEILSKNHVNQLVKKVENIPGSKIDRIRPSQFIHTLTFNPIETIIDYWRMNYPPVKTRNRYVIPSTYGKSYLFPFKTTKPQEKEPKMQLINLFKTIEFVDKKKTFLEALARYKHFLSRSEMGPTCDCSLQVLFDGVVGREDSTLCRHLAERNYRHSTMTGRYFSRYVRNNLVPQLLRMGTKKFNVSRNLKTMRFHLHHIYERSSPIYFESPRGAVFLILLQIIDSAEDIIFNIHRCDRMDDLMDKPISDLTEDMLLDLAKCIKPIEMGLGEITRQEVLDVLRSAKELKEYFLNMREALEYRRYAITAKGDEFGEISCRRVENAKLTTPWKYRIPLPSITPESSGSIAKVPKKVPSLLISDKNLGFSLFQFFGQVMRKKANSRPRSPGQRSTTPPTQEEVRTSIPGFKAERCEWVNLEILKIEKPEKLEGHVPRFGGTKREIADALKYLLLRMEKRLKGAQSTTVIE